MMAGVVSKTNILSPCNNCSGRGGTHARQQPVFGNKSTHFSSALCIPSSILRSLRSSPNSDLFGRKVVFGGQQGGLPQKGNHTLAQMSIGIGKSLRWWDKGLHPNMKEVTGAQDLVESLWNAGDKLLVVDFFSPGCGGCKALHPKICQLAEMNPDVQFLQVNYEEHKSMCYSLNVHVLPFFRFYRGAHGRLCSFSCTNATIKKFKDALAKHRPDRCSIGPPKGLEEKELVALSANKDLSFSYTSKRKQPLAIPAQEEILITGTAPGPAPVPVSHLTSSGSALPLPLPLQSATDLNALQDIKDKTMVPYGR